MAEPAIFSRASVKQHRAAIIWFCFFSVSSLCASIMTALAGTNWATCDDQTRFLIFISVLGGWTTTVGALFKNTAKKDPSLTTQTGDSNPPIP